MVKVTIFLLIVFFLIPGVLLSDEKDGNKQSLYTGLTFRNIGPAIMSGRISDIAVHPHDRATWYVAVGSGGVWKTENAGTTWTPIFDSQPSYSIGCVSLDPHNPNIVWVGTGENVSGRHVGFGDGIYKSLNGGKTWKNMGLKKSEHISRIVIDPRDTNVIYAAVEGPLWAPGGDRGLYKSTDGGETWVISLKISENTGITSVVMDPGNPDILYAAAYQRRRSVAAFMGGGPESAIYKSIDAGKHWRKLTDGLPNGHMGKIGLAVSPMKPGIVYATIEALEKEKGFYRSEDWGESWEKRNTYISGGTGPHYYQEIYADPHQFDCLYQMDVWMNVTYDGGKSFQKIGETFKHSDNHALAFDPHDPDYLLAGTDGGLYETWDRGKTWKFLPNLPLTQFYKIALDNALPFYNVHGGTQDNGSQMGPSRTLNQNGIINSDWIITLSADGYSSAVDPVDPNIIYCEWQMGNLYRYNMKTGESVDIKPDPGKDQPPSRWNWDSPIIISPHDHKRLYFGSQDLYCSNDCGDSWSAVSPDLSRGIFRYQQEIMGKTWSADALWDHGAMSFYGCITTISESPRQEGLIYVGTDDGLIQVTEDGGKNWRKIDKLPGIPEFAFVNEVKASEHDAGTVFAVFDNHKRGDFKPYIMKSSDRGRTWSSITGDIPDRHITWCIVQDHVKPNLLFTGTEFGIFFTPDGGLHWHKLTGGLPTISFRDLEIQKRENDLVGASFGRGIYILDDYSPLREVMPELWTREAMLFPVKKALSYIPRTPLGSRDKADQGHAFFTAPNPPFGAVFTYYLKESMLSGKEKRLDMEKKLDTEGNPIPFPGWHELYREEWEDKPAVILTIKDMDGQVVRRLNGPVTSGIHRVTWDLRYPAVNPTRITQENLLPWERHPIGPMVVPGTFRVELAKRIDGVLSPFGEPQIFTVESLGLSGLTGADKAAIMAFQAKAGRLQRVMMGADKILEEVIDCLRFIKKALMDTPNVDIRLYAEAVAIEKRAREISIELNGDEMLRERGEPVSPSLIRRISAPLNTTEPITATVKRNYEIAAAEYSILEKKLRQLVDVDLKKLEQDMDAAGAPWTPGRDIPKWND